jgi:hypothetical protein
MIPALVIDCTEQSTTQVDLPAPSLEEAKEAKKAAIKTEQSRRFLAGWAYDFGAAGTHTLDLRDADDKANWTLLLIKTQGMIAAGAGAATVKIRTAANATIEVSATVANEAMATFLAWGEAMLARKWALDQETEGAEDHAALTAIDITAGWP